MLTSARLKKYSIIVLNFGSFRKALAKERMFTWLWEELRLDAI
jgi:hypothetical protein